MCVLNPKGKMTATIGAGEDDRPKLSTRNPHTIMGHKSRVETKGVEAGSSCGLALAL